MGGQTAFTTVAGAYPRSNYVEVYRNGLLQREGAAADYTTLATGGTVRVTFNPQPLGPVPDIGDYVTLFYYR